MLTHFDHVTIAVKDLDAAIECYRLLLGSEPSWRGDHPELGTQAALFALSNGCIELLSPIEGAPEADGLRDLLVARGEGVQAIAFGGTDASALSTLLRSRGVRATRPTHGSARGPNGELRHYQSVELSTRDTRGLSVLAVERPDAATLRAAVPPTAECVDALDHVLIATSAVDAARSLYANGLGLRLALDTEFGGRRMLFLRVGGVTIEVVHDATLGDLDRFTGIAYRTRDLNAAHARLRDAGFSVGEPRAGNKPGTHVFSVRDGTCGVPTLILRDPARD